jgi:hypothetical protein
LTELRLDEPLPFRVLLDEAVRRARPHFFGILGPAVLPPALLAAVIPFLQASAMGPALAAGKPFSEVLPYLPAFAGILILAIGIWVLTSLTVLVAGTECVTRGTLDMGRAWRTALQPGVLGTYLLKGMGVGLGMLFCLLPGFYLSLAWGLCVPVVVAEGLRGSGALRRSHELLRHNPGRRLGRDPRVKLFVLYLTGALIGWTVNMVVSMPFAIVQQVVMFRQIASGAHPDPAAMMADMAWLQAPQGVLNALVQISVQIYMAFGLALFFQDLRGRREGLDLEAAIDALATRPAPPA